MDHLDSKKDGRENSGEGSPSQLERAALRAAENTVNGTIPDLTDHGKCTGCGECCSNYLPLTRKDVRRIRKYVREHGIKPVNRITPLLAAPAVDAMCPFMDGSKPVGERCLIYEVRPFVCRHYVCSVNADPDAARESMLAMARDADAMDALTARELNVRQTFFPGSPDNSVDPGRYVQPEDIPEIARFLSRRGKGRIR